MKELRELRKELDAAIKPGQAEIVDRLFDLLEKQVKRCERLEKENEQLRRRIAEDPPATGQEAKAPHESYSLDAEEKRRRRKRRKRKAAQQGKTGRNPSRLVAMQR